MDTVKLNDISAEHAELPQQLCNMCGKCCRAITTPYTHDELVELANSGQEEAKVFVEVFKRYSSVEAAKKAVPDHIENILKELRKNPDFDESKVQFYYCPHLTTKNTCAIHATRPDCCRRAPRNGWSLFPPKCGFKGWQFMQRERIKKSVRIVKERLTELELLPDDFYIKTKNTTVGELKQKLLAKIQPWEKYGANFW